MSNYYRAMNEDFGADTEVNLNQSENKLTDEIIDKLDEEMTELKGVGLSDIDIYIINLAISLSQKKVLT